MQTYQYDSLYRLKEANEKAGTTENWKQDFTYDRYGNRLTHDKFINGTQITHDNKTHPTIDPNTNRFSAGQSYGYDKVGNLITDAEGRTFTFDGNNKQRFITDGNNATVGEYFYDGDGMRVKKKVYSGGTLSKTVIFVYSGGKLVEEYSTEAPPTDKKIKYLTEDHLGTPRIITDGNGAVVSRRDFMPFGEEIANNVGTRSTSSFKYSANEDDVRQKFTGYQQDSETQLDFAEARMYENRHARFTAVDPLLASGRSANPQTFNRYVYVGNSPITITDPTGLTWYYNAKLDKYDWWDEEKKEFRYGSGNSLEDWRRSLGTGEERGSLVYGSDDGFVALDFHSPNFFISKTREAAEYQATDLLRLNPKARGLIRSLGKRGPAVLTIMEVIQPMPLVGPFGSAAGSLLRLGSKGKKIYSLINTVKDVGFMIDPKKFKYFFGLVTKGTKHNVRRSAQNLRDLTKLGLLNQVSY